ncbi:hypothetical protein AWM75_00835 [Aerococcus urinaehominis]|uniref:Phosphatidylglycerol lysyltransferase n=1 Tax=Aerococcus urinaehominis TaxID=128944 RepID=A0A0X8FJU5_9LACT|nr:bifunctional lysylphosphatidylglycerol flippase/synthetase MprF [Aerococcus urinaehominis]AMB98627.1 hypothetical protein AWM75_00835 [Aerococcus urinaehominis]SDL95826.1 phosphatidylglycerol lysyltransferase [Aerococcus urinaehominis]
MTYKDRLKQILRIIFYLFVFALIAYLATGALHDIDWESFRQAIGQVTWPRRLALVLFALVAFSFNGLYDWNASQAYPMTASFLDRLKVGWISQAFSEFVDIAGMTAAGLRTNFYRQAGLTSYQALHISLVNQLASFLGLVFILLAAGLASLKAGLYWPLLIGLSSLIYLPLFIFGDRLKKVRGYLNKKQMQTFDMEAKLRYIPISILDWTSALLYFLFAMASFNPGFDWGQGLIIYASAILVGIFSFVPGGVGTFDLTVLLMMQEAGYQKANILAGLVVIRVCYYLVPWLMATSHLANDWHRAKTDRFHQTVWSNLTVNLLAATMLVVGVLISATVLSPGLFERIRFIQPLLPFIDQRLSTAISLAIGMVTTILSLGIHYRIKRVYWLSLVLLPVACFLSLVRGFPQYIAIIIAGLWLVLYANRKQFNRESLSLSRRNVSLALALSFMVLVTTTVVLGLRVIKIKGEFIFNISLLHLPFYLVIIVALALLILFSQPNRPSFQPPSENEIIDYLALGEKYGTSEYSALVHLADKQIYFSESKQSALLYRPAGSNMLVLGDPIGLESDFSNLISDFATYCHTFQMAPAYYEVTPKYLDIFCGLGYLTVKIGESARINLESFSFEGKKNRNYRKVRNGLENAGLEFAVINPPYSDQVIAELAAVSTAWLANRRELGFSLGSFDPNYLQTSQIAVVRRQGKIIAFANLMVFDKQTLSVDLMRYQNQADIDQLMDMLIIQLIAWGQDQGYAYFDLGMAPLANVGQESFSRSRDQVLKMVYEYGNRAYGFKGLRAYKAKYRPEWINRYLIYTDSTALPQVLLSLYEVIHRS